MPDLDKRCFVFCSACWLFVSIVFLGLTRSLTGRLPTTFSLPSAEVLQRNDTKSKKAKAAAAARRKRSNRNRASKSKADGQMHAANVDGSDIRTTAVTEQDQPIVTLDTIARKITNKAYSSLRAYSVG